MAQMTDAWQQLSAHTGVPIKGKFPTESEIEEMVDRSMRPKRDGRSGIMKTCYPTETEAAWEVARLSEIGVSARLYQEHPGWMVETEEEHMVSRVKATFTLMEGGLTHTECGCGWRDSRQTESRARDALACHRATSPSHLEQESAVMEAKVSDFPVDETPGGYKVDSVAFDELKESGVTPEVAQVVRDFHALVKGVAETGPEEDKLSPWPNYQHMALELLKLAYRERATRPLFPPTQVPEKEDIPWYGLQRSHCERCNGIFRPGKEYADHRRVCHA